MGKKEEVTRREAMLAGYDGLVAGVIRQAVNDYKKYWHRKQKPKISKSEKQYAEWQMESIRGFFLGEWFAYISNLDGKKLLEMLEAQLNGKL